jgi:hypothetical protein
MHVHLTILLLAHALAFAAWSSTAVATELLFPGIQPKVSAGGGQTVSRGPASLFYNPANLIFSKFIEPYIDVSLANVTYQYQHTDTEKYDPVVVGVTAPPVTVGAGFRPVPSFAMGVAFFPTGSGAVQLVESVPLDVGSGNIQLTDIITKKSGSKLAAGAAFRFAFPFTVGAGLIRTSEQTQLQIFPVESEEALFDAAYQGNANQFLVGARSELVDRYLVVALSYRTAAQVNYAGDVGSSLNNGEFVAYEGVGYLPGAIGFGAETRFSSVGLFLDYVRETWSGARTVYRNGLSDSNVDEYDYIDTNNIALGLKWWMAPKHMIEVAFGSHGANIGDGTETVEGAGLQDDEEDLKIAGPTFGNTDAIPRTIFSGGYRAKITGNGYFQLGAQYQTGSRVVPEGFGQEGQYTLRVILLSLGLAYGF